MKTPILLLFSLLTLYAGAQSKSQENFKKKFRQHQVSGSHKNTRVLKQRLIKDSTFHNYQNLNTFEWSTSNDYQYSNERGSFQYIMENEIYVDCYADTFNYFEKSGAIIDKYKSLAKYNATNHYTEYIELYFNDVSMTYDSTFKAEFLYNGQNLNTESIFSVYNGAAWEYTDKYINSYNGTGQLMQTIELLFNGANFDSTGKTDHFYSGSNLVLRAESSYDLGLNAWMPESKDSLIYNAQNKVTIRQRSSGWNGNMYNNFNNVYNGYDANMRRDTTYSESWMQGGPVTGYNFKKFQYTGNDTFFSTVFNYNMQNILESGDSYSFDANKNMINSTHSSYSPFDTMTRYTDYYYEDYNVSTAIAELSQVKELSLYPNPAGNIAYLSSFNTGSESMLVTVADVTGKILISKQEQGFIGDHLIQIPTSSLNPGIYYVIVYNGTTKETMKLVISR